ncbi:MAG: acyl--CoA ligase [Enterococcus sp.]|nr:acyl--CoA ligase [Enterococcus sp.]
MKYPDCSMYDAVHKTAKKYPDYTAYIFMGRKTKYKDFEDKIHLCAKALKSIGVQEGDRVSIALPNCPQALQVFYAVNLIGAIANMVHPLASQNETLLCLKEANSKFAVCLDSFYEKFIQAKGAAFLKKIIVTSISYEFCPVKKITYYFAEGWKAKKPKPCKELTLWKKFLACGNNFTGEYKAKKCSQDPAVILYSGGSTGNKKGVLLSNLNFNAIAKQVIASSSFKPADKMLAVLPLFHGFGLGVCVHTILSHGGSVILVPRFKALPVAKTILRYRCNFVSGVPAMYEKLIKLKVFNDKDLSFLQGVYLGGDNLSSSLKHQIDNFLKVHNAKIYAREGYGTTETTTVCCLNPEHANKDLSVGIPLPDMEIKIVKPGTQKCLEAEEEGQVVISGPSTMIEYVNKPEETAKTLQKHKDGLVWVHTDDIGYLDSDGFLYLKGRMKRMIIRNGYNIYPDQIEQALASCEAVFNSCVIGFKHETGKTQIKAYIVLHDGYNPNSETKNIIFEHSRKNISKYEMFDEIEFIESLPITAVGKVDFRKLKAEVGHSQHR